MTTRPASIEWTGDRYDILPDSEHGAPLLLGGRLVAGYRDARYLNHRDAHTVKQWHVAVVSHEYAVAGGIAEISAACDPRRIMLGGLTENPAHEIPESWRCRRPACAALFRKADQEAQQPR
ncbi:hypothetical protein AB0F17_43105 [Nonomuraea sp. NPDC026600]|uniref:hypothetical protein n=1 Tax=Nonomuraea sp. NPDC026600 TaxID=3155363 RepID=UPI00340CB2DA